MKFSRGIFHDFPFFYFHFWLFPVTEVLSVPGGGGLIIGVSVPSGGERRTITESAMDREKNPHRPCLA